MIYIYIYPFHTHGSNSQPRLRVLAVCSPQLLCDFALCARGLGLAASGAPSVGPNPPSLHSEFSRSFSTECHRVSCSLWFICDYSYFNLRTYRKYILYIYTYFYYLLLVSITFYNHRKHPHCAAAVAVGLPLWGSGSTDTTHATHDPAASHL